MVTGAVPAAWAEDRQNDSGDAKADPQRSTVVLVRDREAVEADGKTNGEVLSRMLDEGVTALTGKDDAKAAWASLFEPTDTVGIKTNVWRFLRTPPELEEAIQARLQAVGIDGDRIAADDRGILKNPVFQNATALVNVRPLRTHHWAGVGSLIKNYIMFDPEPPKYHPDGCASLATCWDLPIVKGKTRLNVLVMLTPQFHHLGRHHFDWQYTWQYKGLLVGTDPVAVDSVGLRIMQAKRRLHFGEDRPMTPPAHHIALADTKYGLGTADPNKIELVKLGWEKDVLI